jgi:hypothetical protein
MNQVRVANPGKTRSCPHCKATILDSSAICPGCGHHLRFDPATAGQRPGVAISPLRVEGTIRHPATGDPWEYSVVLVIRNGRGEEVTRQVVGVGALSASEQRTFALSVEVFAPKDTKTIEGVPTKEIPGAAPQSQAASSTVRSPPPAATMTGSKPALQPPSRAPAMPSRPPPPVKPLSQQASSSQARQMEVPTPRPTTPASAPTPPTSTTKPPGDPPTGN